MDQAVMTRTQLRDHLAAINLTAAPIAKAQFNSLQALIRIELKAAGLFRGTLQTDGPVKIKGSGKTQILLRSDYFTQREGVTFHADGLIGIAGWADDETARPIIMALKAWADDVVAKRRVSDRELAGPEA